MKAIQIEKPEVLKIIDMDKPALTQQDNVIVKMKAAGICGSDVGIYHGTNAAATATPAARAVETCAAAWK